LLSQLLDPLSQLVHGQLLPLELDVLALENAGRMRMKPANINDIGRAAARLFTGHSSVKWIVQVAGGLVDPPILPKGSHPGGRAIGLLSRRKTKGERF
jgi:hypothetical protein